MEKKDDTKEQESEHEGVVRQPAQHGRVVQTYWAVTEKEVLVVHDLVDKLELVRSTMGGAATNVLVLERVQVANAKEELEQLEEQELRELLELQQLQGYGLSKNFEM